MKIKNFFSVSWAWPSTTVVRLDDLALSIMPPLVHPPMTIMALLLTVAIATADLAESKDAIFLHDLLESSYNLHLMLLYHFDHHNWWRRTRD